MKIRKYISKVFISLIFLLAFSCSKEEGVDIQTAEVSMSKIQKVLNLNEESQKMAYGNLNQDEKIFIWQDRLKQISELDRINVKQVSYLNQLAKSITKDNFFNTSKKDSYTKYLQNMKIKGHEIFSKNEMITYFLTLKNIDGIEKTSDTTIAGAGSDCHCSTEDDWCNYNEKCTSKWCVSEDSDGGCGWFLQQRCEGECKSE